MPENKIFLKAVMVDRNGKRVWSGEYACSLCDGRFRPDYSDPAKLTQQFDEHRERHLAEMQKDVETGENLP